MNQSAGQLQGSLFYEELIRSFVHAPFFTERPWIAEWVDDKLADDRHRFLLLKAEPGAGKTALMAWLADMRPDWPRYFIRRNSQEPLSSGDARSFLFALGHQLAALRPSLFEPDFLRIVVDQKIEELRTGGRAIGIRVEDLHVSPFYRTALLVRQQVKVLEGELEGLSAKRLVAEPRFLELGNLQHLALLCPAEALLREDSSARIVILIDALDELRYTSGRDNLLNWLANCPELPPNVRFVLTSRPDDELLSLLVQRQRQFLIPDENLFAGHNEPVRNDLRRTISAFAAQESIGAAMAAGGIGADTFIDRAVDKADGNFQYLTALMRAIDQTLATGRKDQLEVFFKLKGVPGGLKDLYAFFLNQVKKSVDGVTLPVEDPATGEIHRLPAWSTVHRPVLGILSVAREPVSAEQIRSFASIEAAWNDYVDGLGQLRQFLDEERGRYRFFHASMPEFLTDAATRSNPETAGFHQEPEVWHRRIAQYYRKVAGPWGQGDWNALDAYGWSHLAAHASEAGRKQGFQLLFELGDGGFLGAKHRVSSSLAALEDDWVRLFQACRHAGDFCRFVEYGFQRAPMGTMGLALQSPVVAGAAARLAVAGGDRKAMERFLSDLSIVPHPLARLRAETEFLRALLAADPFHPLGDILTNRIKTALEALPPGDDHDEALVSFLTALSLKPTEAWMDLAAEALPLVAGFVPRIRLLGALASGYASRDRILDAWESLDQALDACREMEMKDDMVPKILQMVFGESRHDDPEVLLSRALWIILEAVPALEGHDLVAVVDRLLQETSRLQDKTEGLRLRTMATEVLASAGLAYPARKIARQLLDEALASLKGETSLMEDREPSTVPGLLRSVWARLRSWFNRLGRFVRLRKEEPTPQGLEAGVADSFESPARGGQTAVDLLTILPAMAPLQGAEALDRWRQGLDTALEGMSGAEDLFRVAGMVAGLDATDALKPVLAQAFERIAARSSEIETGEISLGITAALAAGYARVGDQATARNLLQGIWRTWSAAALGPSESPEQSQGRLRALAWVWAAACSLRDPDLLQTTLEWLKNVAASALPRDQRGDLWVDCCSALPELSDRTLGNELLQSLASLLVFGMDAAGYRAIAWLQMAEAYCSLGLKEKCRPLLEESVQVAREKVSERDQIRVLGRAAHLHADLDDPNAGSELIAEALEGIPHLYGDNIKAECLDLLLPAVEALSGCGDLGRDAAEVLLNRASEIAAGITLGEYAISSLSKIHLLAAKAGLPQAAGSLEDLTEKHLLEGIQEGRMDSNRLRAVMRAIRGLDQAGSPAAPRLLKRMEQCVEELPCQSDSERAHLCQACTHLAYAYRDLGLGEFSSRWRDLASRMAQDTQDPDWRTDAAVALAHSESVQGNSQAAGAWLAEAVSAWTGIEEWSFARWRIRDIFEAWALIPERWTREDYLEKLRALLWSVPDLELRDTLRARLAIASWDNPPLSRELMEGIHSAGGLETALTALHEAKTLPDWVLPGALEDVLEKCTKQSVPFFAGQALLAAQTAARFGIYTRETVATVLAGIEDRMREFAPLPEGGPVSSPAELRVTHYMDSLR